MRLLIFLKQACIYAMYIMPYSTVGQRTAECWSVDHRCFAFKQISKLTLMKLNLIESLERVCVRCVRPSGQCTAFKSLFLLDPSSEQRRIRDADAWGCGLKPWFYLPFLSAMHLADSGRLIILASVFASVLASISYSGGKQIGNWKYDKQYTMGQFVNLFFF